jgi:hypothetical protein
MQKRTRLLLVIVFSVALFNLFLFRRSIYPSSDEDEGPIIRYQPYQPPPPPPQQQQSSTTTTLNNDNELAIAQNNLIRCQSVNKMKLVIIDTPQTHSAVRLLVGSIHQYHKGDLKMYIYGLNLPTSIESEILLWEYVTFFDIEKEFVTSVKSDESSQHLEEKRWRDIVIYDALERAGKIMYLNSNVLLKSAISNDFIQSIEKVGALFATTSDSELRDYRQSSIVSESSFAQDHNNADIQAYILGSNAFKNYLEPLIECARRKCSSAEQKMLNADWRSSSEFTDTEREIMSIGKMPSAIRKLDSQHDKDSQCHIINREDFILSYKQLPGVPSKSWEVSVTDNQARAENLKDKTIIALGFPSTSKGNPNPTIHTIPFIRVFLSSLVPTIRGDANQFHYILYMGYDEGDAFYDNLDNRKELRAKVAEMTQGLPVEFRMIRVVNSAGWVPFIWNALFQHAVDDGADYFYQCNDDVRFITQGWTNVLVKALVDSPAGKNVGVSGPVDTNNPRLLTQAFVHKTHYDIFGYLYPYVFRNWFSDDWLTQVYDKERGLMKMGEVRVKNEQSFGTRYHVCDFNLKLSSSLQAGRVRIRNYLDSIKN